MRSVAFKPERGFGKLFIVASVFWHFIIQEASAKKKVKLSNPRGIASRNKALPT